MGRTRGVYRRFKIDKFGAITYYGKWLPRFKPPREKLASGKTLIHNHLPLGGCDTSQGAKILRHIAAFYYGKAGGLLDLQNGEFFSIPSMSEQEKQSLHGMEKVDWVSRKAKVVFEDFQQEKAASRNGALSSGEGATAFASSSVITDEAEPAAAPSPDNLEGSALSQILEDLASPEFEMDCSFDIRQGN